jgi:acetyltransferase-like isoleucine patch superfamily enzyme
MSDRIDVTDFRPEWDYASLKDNIVLGEGCYLESRGSFGEFRSRRDPGLVLGRGVQVHAWTSFNVAPEGFIEIGDDCVLVGAGFHSRERITVGRGVVISYNVFIFDSDMHPRDPVERCRDAVWNRPSGSTDKRPQVFAKPIVIEDGVSIGAGAMILKGSRIGAGARVGAGAVVAGEVPARATVEGNPAQVVG